MTTLSLNEILLIVAASTFILGMFTFVIGVFILVSKATGNKEIHTIAQQTSQIAQKGIAEDIAGLVGNASALLDTIAEMVRTTAGVGVFLAINGSLLMGAGLWLMLQLQ